MSLSDAVRTDVRAEMSAARQGSRTATARRLAEAYGVSVATIYRVAGRGGTKRARAPQRPEYREWVRIAVQLAHRSPKPMPLEVAIEGGVRMGVIPPEAAAMPIATANRLRREMGLRGTAKRTHRLHADHPMQALLVDGSSSEHLVVDRALPDGDYLLKLHRRPYPASGYKNKPLGPDRLRVLVYGVWDMCTGYTLSRYVVARGESALDQMEFLCWAFAEKEDPRVVMHGLPDDLWSDLGSWYKSASARDLMERLGVFVPPSQPYAKERMGGVERPHRTRWSRFERALFLRREITIRLSELNAQLAEYEIRENARRPSRTPAGGRPASRRDAWVALTNARPAGSRLRKCPPDPIGTMAQEARRTLDANGILSWGGVEYECADWHSRRVLAVRSMDGGGDVVLRDEATGETRVARRYEARPYGEVRPSPAGELDRLLREELDVPGADIYAPAGGEAKVVPMPARSAPPAPLENPLLADRHGSLDEAMLAFGEIYPHPLSPGNRAAVVEAVEGAGLDRSAVKALALRLAALGAAGN